MKKLSFLISLFFCTVQIFAQKIEIISPNKGFKEIDFSNPAFTKQPDPIPKSGGIYNTTHYLAVHCKADGEEGTIHQYINQSNGVVGIPTKLLKKWETGTENLKDMQGGMDYWVILPNMTQRMYVNAREEGKIVMEMTAGDGMQTTQMARFDAYMQGDIFWRNAKKIETKTFPKDYFINSPNNTGQALTVDKHEYISEEGKMWVYMKELGLATGNLAAVKKTYAATGMGGMGWVYNKFNDKVYLVMQILKANNPNEGCRIVALYPEKYSFSGTGYKPMGDMMYDKLKETHAENMKNVDENLAKELETEDDPQLKALYQEKAQVEQALQQKTNDNMSNAAMLNDASEITRSTMEMAMDGEFMYRTMDIDLRIGIRKIQIEMNRDISTEQRQELNKELNCKNKQRQILANYRADAKKLKEKVKGLEQHEQIEKLGALMNDFQQRMAQTCQ